MQIAAIDVFTVDLPYAGGVYRLSGGREYRSFEATIVRLTADDGTTGWGESTPFGSNYVAAHALGVQAGIAELAPTLLGVDPRTVDRVNDVMDANLTGHPHAKAPLDIACWDLFGRSVGLPVHTLLGGSTRQRLPTISSIGSGDPDDMRARVAEHQAAGFRGHSLKVGALDDEIEVRSATVRRSRRLRDGGRRILSWRAPPSLQAHPRRAGTATSRA